MLAGEGITSHIRYPSKDIELIRRLRLYEGCETLGFLSLAGIEVDLQEIVCADKWRTHQGSLSLETGQAICAA